MARQSALDWGLSRSGVTGHCVASQSMLDWGDSLLSVAGRCLDEAVLPPFFFFFGVANSDVALP